MLFVYYLGRGFEVVGEGMKKLGFDNSLEAREVLSFDDSATYSQESNNSADFLFSNYKSYHVGTAPFLSS